MSDVTAAAATPATHHVTAWHSPGGFGFRDLLDIINPLQHLPVIGSIYRWVTGDRPGEAAQIAGDALYGGPIGLAFGLIGAATEDSAGHDLGERALVAVFGNHDDGGVEVAAVAAPVAAAMAKPSPAAARTAIAASVPTGASVPLFGGIALTQPEREAAAAPASRPAPAVPDHPPMPLPGHAAAQAAPAASQHGSAAQQFIAHNAMLERQLTAGSQTPASTKPVPLVLPAGTLPSVHPVAPVPAAPVDISKKMLDALDKYMKLEKDREKEREKAATPAPPVDISL
jgi:hypothetical protein